MTRRRLNPFAVAPDGYATLRAVENYLQTCGLDHTLIALVKTRVSQINGCAYCLHMHTEEARKLGESDMRLHLLDAWRESNLYSERERAALAWAESLTNIAVTHAPDDVYDEVRRQFSEKELADLSIVIAMINAWNRLAIGLRSIGPSGGHREGGMTRIWADLGVRLICRTGEGTGSRVISIAFAGVCYYRQ